MKRLGVFCMPALLCIGFLLVATPSITHAQTVASQQDISKNDLLQQGNLLFNSFINQLEAKQANPRQIPSLQSASDAQIASYVQGNKDLISGIQQSQQVFINKFNTPAAQSSSIYADYSAALLAAKDTVNQIQASTASIRNNALLRTEVTAFSKQLDDAALARQRDLINAGNTTDAVALQNAVGVQRNEQAKQQSADQCSLLNGNLLGCVDQLVAWFIKNTLLRLAGVILWLCANMLDFAMNMGILQFSKWAPDALYDIWIVVRQITSLAIVFAGLYLGFMYIIGKEDTFGRYIGWVILFALFVNFSYPLTRMLIDVSNIISLNIYSSAIPNTLTGTGSSAGTEIMNRLGLQALVNYATEDSSGAADVFKSITSTPVALVTVAFVAYAAYVFFMATAIIATRTAILVFLTIGSPLLLIDSVVPKLGGVVADMRKMFFEQLVVAPVFTIMLAITLKFMSVFSASGGPLSSLSNGGATLQNLGQVGVQTSVNITLFFSVLMMLVMLHIMLKVTKSIAGEAGNYATNFMGKVGGFGLAAATGGAGILARGTVGQAAMKFRDGAWMDRMKDTTMGRGLYGLSNSLAQSTYDARNIGVVSKGLATAGLTGGLGLTMQGGSKKGFETTQQDRQKRVIEFGSNIKDDSTRSNYFNTANRFRLTKVDTPVLEEALKKTQGSKDDQIKKMLSTTEKKERETLVNQALIGKDYALADKLRQADQFHSLDNTNPETPNKKADLLKKMGVTTEEKADEFIEKDAFKDLAEAHEKEVERLQNEISKKDPVADKEEIGRMQKQIGAEKATYKEKVSSLKKETLAAFTGSTASTTPGATPPRTPQPPTSPAAASRGPSTRSSDDDDLAGGATVRTPPIQPLSPGGAGAAQYASKEYEKPAYMRQGIAEPVLKQKETVPNPPPEPAPAGGAAPVPSPEPQQETPRPPIDVTREASNETPFHRPEKRDFSNITMYGESIDLTKVKTQSLTSFLKKK